jgi:hypothetical protein
MPVRGCTHVFVQGSKKGKQCGVSCRGKYCYSHKKHNINRKKQYYQEIKEKNGNKGVEKIKDMVNRGIIPDIVTYQLKINAIDDNIKIILKQIIGIHIKLGNMSEENAYDKYDHIINKKIYRDADKYINKISKNQEHSEEYIKRIKELYISEDPRRRSVFIPYKGSDAGGKKLCKKLIAEKDILNNKRKIYVEITKIIEKACEIIIDE